MPTGPWVGIMIEHIGKWCLDNPSKAHDLDAVHTAADAIFEQNRQSSPAFNPELPFLHLDELELLKISDPLGVRPLLVEAAHLKWGDVSNWAKGYQKKAVVAVIEAVARATNNKQTASLCAQHFAQLAAALKDITLGEVV